LNPLATHRAADLLERFHDVRGLAFGGTSAQLQRSTVKTVN
jgi:hypothetical protein